MVSIFTIVTNNLILQITITTVDRRKSPLIFKCTLLEMSPEEQILLDFRLSRGDGLEFKRHYLRIKEELREWEVFGGGAVLFNLYG